MCICCLVSIDLYYRYFQALIFKQFCQLSIFLIGYRKIIKTLNYFFTFFWRKCARAISNFLLSHSIICWQIWKTKCNSLEINSKPFRNYLSFQHPWSCYLILVWFLINLYKSLFFNVYKLENNVGKIMYIYHLLL